MDTLAMTWVTKRRGGGGGGGGGRGVRKPLLLAVAVPYRICIVYYLLKSSACTETLRDVKQNAKLKDDHSLTSLIHHKVKSMKRLNSEIRCTNLVLSRSTSII